MGVVQNANTRERTLRWGERLRSAVADLLDGDDRQIHQGFALRVLAPFVAAAMDRTTEIVVCHRLFQVEGIPLHVRFTASIIRIGAVQQIEHSQFEVAQRSRGLEKAPVQTLMSQTRGIKTRGENDRITVLLQKVDAMHCLHGMQAVHGDVLFFAAAHCPDLRHGCTDCSKNG